MRTVIGMPITLNTNLVTNALDPSSTGFNETDVLESITAATMISIPGTSTHLDWASQRAFYARSANG